MVAATAGALAWQAGGITRVRADAAPRRRWSLSGGSGRCVTAVCRRMWPGSRRCSESFSKHPASLPRSTSSRSVLGKCSVDEGGSRVDTPGQPWTDRPTNGDDVVRRWRAPEPEPSRHAGRPGPGLRPPGPKLGQRSRPDRLQTASRPRGWGGDGDADPTVRRRCRSSGSPSTTAIRRHAGAFRGDRGPSLSRRRERPSGD